MPGAARQSQDSAGGTIVGGAASVIVNGTPIARRGDPIASHAPYGPPHPPHASPVMVGASSTVFAEGKPVSRLGDPASCGHPATGSSDVIVG